MAAVSTRGLVRHAHWRGRREAQHELSQPYDQTFRGFIQINLIRTN